MSISIPDPKTWRPSKNEWYPRLYVGQHWKDHSIPLYFSVEGWDLRYDHNKDKTIVPRWSVCPLGNPVRGKPSRVNFGDVIKHMSGHTGDVAWAPEVNKTLEKAALNSLRDAYVAQGAFPHGARVYDEAELTKANPPPTIRLPPASHVRKRVIEDDEDGGLVIVQPRKRNKFSSQAQL